MAGSSVEDIRKHLKVYYMVFGALAGLTALTVVVAELHFLTVPQAIGLALVVATIKGSLVACYFMHLISERGMVFWVLGICALFFVVLLLLPVVTTHTNVGTY
jgi:cytochrome c oxidase subunit 4